ncbi:MAG: glyoxylate/hydroxypyruvate reductase A [Rhodobacteraceae bacterium]|nr:glyoxylate/hydroxypyruvate reductase A [Paracoccaceae bacterium]
MTLQVYFNAGASLWPEYEPLLRDGFKVAGIKVNLFDQTDDPASVDYMIYAPRSKADDLSAFTNVRLIQSLWAGPDLLIANPTLTQPLARMVDDDMKLGMIDYVMGHALWHHLNMPLFSQAKPGEWLSEHFPGLPRDRTVAILGVGQLGMACARALAVHGFRVLGWSRSQKSDDLVSCHAGPDGLSHVLGEADIVVLLTPHTPQTENLIRSETIALMKPGASLINPGRGALVNDADLLAALDSGQISYATLDAFRSEPLPADNPYWTHPRVQVTPHVASETRAETAVQIVVENLRRAEAGETVRFLVDRGLSY